MVGELTGTGSVKSQVTSGLKHLYRVGEFTGTWYKMGEMTGTVWVK